LSFNFYEKEKNDIQLFCHDSQIVRVEGATNLITCTSLITWTSPSFFVERETENQKSRRRWKGMTAREKERMGENVQQCQQFGRCKRASIRDATRYVLFIFRGKRSGSTWRLPLANDTCAYSALRFLLFFPSLLPSLISHSRWLKLSCKRIALLLRTQGMLRVSHDWINKQCDRYKKRTTHTWKK